MIDWTKPLQANGFSTKAVTLVGEATDGSKLIEIYNKVIHRVSPYTGRIEGPVERYVTNVKEPWEKAWELYKTPSYYYKNEEDWFKEVFELGRTWHENQKKT
jgi:hypothetical protein